MLNKINTTPDGIYFPLGEEGEFRGFWFEIIDEKRILYQGRHYRSDGQIKDENLVVTLKNPIPSELQELLGKEYIPIRFHKKITSLPYTHAHIVKLPRR